MNNAIWLAAGATALGTLLIRMLPLYWMQRRRSEASVTEREAAIPAWPGMLAPLMIAALLGISLAPQPGSALTWGATMMGSLATLSGWYTTRSLGLPVAAGVAAYALVVMSGS
ncbi:AzlD domain-containing protein [Kushneria indalinina]|uniref:Branched-subunit amino acid transport protein AzlD n=1 Tax=Kushneria indalinina DSM 14324 TaxID=1122140 RepID=A0A3D9DYI4_9GAMM|nr:AzlD domain-containing protein [Kushneria indalinina]REC95725.1 branched-subunit amino acid transport protein AzlD [Kushneria indalinina DSM 14324]